MVNKRRAPTVLIRTRTRTKLKMVAEAQRLGKKMPDFMDMMFKKYLKGGRR